MLDENSGGGEREERDRGLSGQREIEGLVDRGRKEEWTRNENEKNITNYIIPRVILSQVYLELITNTPSTSTC